ncbi:GntR family transcriptional regulator [Microvirga antarctica]|uniref:GntR family transcriptional regulator n=1 Tax=Microvirga antarctica TaxID=2819233 RepID=UPI001B304778|nr:GntR family transcriptional regulator [Microvirga antarctica]
MTHIPDPGVRLGDATYSRLRDMILNGTLPTGTVLHEKRLAEGLLVSRTPVREAISRLISAGLVVRDPGLAPVVRRLSVNEFIEVLHVRRLLEVEAAGRAAERNGTAEYASLREQFVRFRDAQVVDFTEQFNADERLHEILALQADSKLLAELISDLRMKTQIFDATRVPERIKAGSIEHIGIIDSVVSGDVERSREAMRTHIDNVRASVLSHLQRLF